jgi:hypothetical protein
VTPQSAQLELTVDAGSGADEEEVERLARSLRSELLELDVEAVEPAAAGAAPEGTRAVEALMLGALVVRFGRSSESLSALVRTVRAWLGDTDRRVRIELDGDVLELTGASDEERQRLVDIWIERHGRA